MRKPQGILYAVEDRPPIGVIALSGLQHVALMATYLVFPLLLLQATKASAEVAAAVVSLTLLTMAIGTLLQTCRLGPIGSGFLCQPVPSVLYFVPSMAAATHGGIAAVYGMTLAAGLFEVTIARILQRTRKFFPPEIAGLVVLLAGISIGSIGLHTALGAGDPGSAPRPGDAGIALFTLAVMAALNVWGRGLLHIFCVLIGIAAGTVLAWLLGPSAFSANSAVAHASAALAVSPWFAIPGLGHLAWSFDPNLILPFAVAAVAASLKATGNITIGQKASDPEWVRPDMRSISQGIAADGLATAVAGILGTLGVSSATGTIGLASATGVMSRSIGYAIAALLMLIALVPGLSVLLYMLPRPVLGAALMFAATFIIVSGLQIMAARLIDARKTLTIGLALVVAIGFEIYPGMLAVLPEPARVAVSSSFVLGTVIAMALNALFHIGLHKTVKITVGPGDVGSDAAEDFITGHGAAWGARREIIERARFVLLQSIDTLVAGGIASGPVQIEGSFDEFNLNLRISYEGAPLELPRAKLTADEILSSEEGERRLAGYLLRASADEVSVTQKNGQTTMRFHFDH